MSFLRKPTTLASYRSGACVLPASQGARQPLRGTSSCRWRGPSSNRGGGGGGCGTSTQEEEEDPPEEEEEEETATSSSRSDSNLLARYCGLSSLPLLSSLHWHCGAAGTMDDVQVTACWCSSLLMSYFLFSAMRKRRRWHHSHLTQDQGLKGHLSEILSFH